MSKFEILVTKPNKDYELIDSGDGEKLERFGQFVVCRPDPQALWTKHDATLWGNADATFKSKWIGGKNFKNDWKIKLGDNMFMLKLSAFKHVGIFPEQLSNWDWIKDKIANERPKRDREINLLNLFGYTGGATLAALRAGAKVTHVDGSKPTISWAKGNAEASGLGDKPVRWILDDAIAYVKREIRRGVKYDAIVLDPPSYGRGPEGEEWKIEKNLPELIALLKEIISDNPIFILINGYASGYSALSYKNSLEYFEKKYGGSITCGELGMEEFHGSRILPAGIFARWQKTL